MRSSHGGQGSPSSKFSPVRPQTSSVRVGVALNAGLPSRAGIQDLLDDPNELSPAQDEAFHVFQTSQPEYERRVRRQVEQYAAEKFQ